MVTPERNVPAIDLTDSGTVNSTKLVPENARLDSDRSLDPSLKVMFDNLEISSP